VRNLHMLAAMGALASSFAVGNEIPLHGEMPTDLMPAKQRRGKGQSNRRGKGLQAKARKRSNRLTISKRVRRKHRRSA
jgi:hypothetical protein